MRLSQKIVLAVILVGAVAGSGYARPQGAKGAKSQEPAASKRGATSKVDEVVIRIIEQERNEVTAIGLYQPIVETYAQAIKPNPELGEVPKRDYYFISQADFSNGIAYHPLKSGKLGLPGVLTADDFDYRGFLQMAFVDRERLDTDHYKFDYAGREFLGKVRCLMFDLVPLPKSGDGRFQGRVWVEDKDYTIVRFNGLFLRTHLLSRHLYTHFDSWRCNLREGVWLPCYIYSSETDPKHLDGNSPFKAQTRFWGYGRTLIRREEEFSELTIDTQNDIQDDSQEQTDFSPLQAEREWRSMGESNVVESLERSGLLAPPGGPVDKILDTVVNNLVATNNLVIEPEIHCHVLLTSTFEMFSIGHTIIVSRGLLDVLPDEATLATIVAQGIADALVPKPLADEYGFSDAARVSTLQALRVFSFKDSKYDYQASSQKAMELLRNSPYAGKLANAGLFLEQLNSESKALHELISPNLGNRVDLASQLVNSAPSIDLKNLNQIAALPMGSRIKMDPWSDNVEMLKAPSVRILSDREKLPFEITPFLLYLTRYQETAPPTVRSGAGMSTQEQKPATPNK